MTSHNSTMNKFLFVFCLSFIVATLGVGVGQFIPPTLILPLAIVELILIIVIIFVRSKGLSYSILYLFMFISGITLYTTISHYASKIGATNVFYAFIITAIVYGVIALYGYFTKFNFGFLGNVLFFGLLVLIIILLVNLFIPISGGLYLGLIIFGLILFAAYTLYDFNRIARNGIEEDEIPIEVINVYLDFINLYRYMLKLIDFFED